MVSPPNSDAPVATWGWFASGTIPGVTARALALRQVAAAKGLPAAAMVSPPNANATVATCGWFASGTILGVSVGVRVLEQVATTGRLLATGRVSPPESIATKASWGWLSRGAIPDPSSTLVEIVVKFWPEEVVANNHLNLTFPCLKIKYKVDCCIGRMLESPLAPSSREFSLSPLAPTAMASPALVASLPSTGKLRAVIDAGGALLSSTGWPRAVADAFATLLTVRPLSHEL